MSDTIHAKRTNVDTRGFRCLSPQSLSRHLSIVGLIGLVLWVAPQAVFQSDGLRADERPTATSEAAPPNASDEADASDDADGGESERGDYQNEVISGRVGWLAAFLKDHFDITTVPEVAKQSLAVLTDEGEVVPLVENVRARAFRKDERLRDKPLELWVRRYEKQPFAQVLKIVELHNDQRYEVDYWCDVCAIPMYETGPCSCCQDHNRLRKRLLVDGEPGPELSAP